MCRFIESIKLHNGVFMRLDLHQARIDKAFAVYFPDKDIIRLSVFLQQSSFSTDGLYKCRIVYDSEIRQLEYIPYTRREVHSLRLVETNMESLPYKKEDRSGFETAFALRADCDDVLLVKDGLLTDTSYSNIALSDGETWYTPEIPLLYGVNRSQLLSCGKIKTASITPADLNKFQRIRLFNALIEFGELELDISAISE